MTTQGYPPKSDAYPSLRLAAASANNLTQRRAAVEPVSGTASHGPAFHGTPTMREKPLTASRSGPWEKISNLRGRTIYLASLSPTIW
jgi:hypothetical protein